MRPIRPCNPSKKHSLVDYSRTASTAPASPSLSTDRLFLARFEGICLAKLRFPVYGSIGLPISPSKDCIRGSTYVAGTEDRHCCIRHRAGRHVGCGVRSRKAVSLNSLRARPRLSLPDTWLLRSTAVSLQLGRLPWLHQGGSSSNARWHRAPSHHRLRST